jgi:hypothetical protein
MFEVIIVTVTVTLRSVKFYKGDAYECGVCGMAVVVEEPCGCGEEVVLMCCDEPMKARKSKTKTAK